MAEPLREFTRFTWWIQKRARWPPIFGPSQPTWAAGPPVAASKLYRPSPFIIITQPESWYSFTVPRRVEGWVDLSGCYIPLCVRVFYSAMGFGPEIKVKLMMMVMILGAQDFLPDFQRASDWYRFRRKRPRYGPLMTAMKKVKEWMHTARVSCSH